MLGKACATEYDSWGRKGTEESRPAVGDSVGRLKEPREWRRTNNLHLSSDVLIENSQGTRRQGFKRGPAALKSEERVEES